MVNDCCYKRIQNKTVMIQYLLGIVYFLASCAKHDEYSFSETIDLTKIEDNLFLKSILIRRSYGGMKGDMRMLNYLLNYG